MIYSLGMNYYVNGVPCSNIFYYEDLVTAGAGFSTTDLVGAFDTLVVPNFLEIWSTQVQMANIRAEGLWPTKTVPITKEYIDNFGADSGEAGPATLALNITLGVISSNATRSGRIYVAGIPEDNLISSRWSNAFITTATATLVASLVAPVTGASGSTYDPVRVHRTYTAHHLSDVVSSSVRFAAPKAVPITQKVRKNDLHALFAE